MSIKGRIVCVFTMVIMLFSTMGVGAFAEVGDVNTDSIQSTEENNTDSLEVEDKDLSTEIDTVGEGDTEEKAEVEVSPISLRAVAGNGEVTLSWDSEEGKNYNVYYDGDINPINSETIAGSEYKVTGLNNGTEYKFQVKTVEEEDVEPRVSNILAVIPVKLEVTAYAGYFSIHLEWNRVKDARAYKIVRTSNGVSKSWTVSANSDSIRKYKDTARYSYNLDKKPDGGNGINWNKQYKYTVTPIYSDLLVTGVSSNISNGKTCVKPMHYKITFNQTKTLTSHDGKKKKKTFRKGTTVYSHKFGAGLYSFYYNGYLFRVNKVRTYKTGSKMRKCVYWSTTNYSTKEADYFVNDVTNSKRVNNKNWLVWASTQSQHVYVFNWSSSKGKWVNSTYKSKSWNWECASGKASSPSPCGLYYSVKKKISKRHNIPYWTCFLDINAFHGKLRSWVMGKPASGGCIRNNVTDASKIYTYVPKGSRVVCY